MGEDFGISDHELGKRFFNDSTLKKLVCCCTGKAIVVATKNGFNARVELRTAMHPKDIWAMSAIDIKNYDIVRGGGAAPTEYEQVKQLSGNLTGLVASECIQLPQTSHSLFEFQLDLHSLAHATKMAMVHHNGLTHLSISIVFDKQPPRQSTSHWIHGSGVLEAHGLSVDDNGSVSNTKLIGKFPLPSIQSKGRVNFELKCNLNEWLDFLMVYDMSISTFANHHPAHHHSEANLTIDKDGVVKFTQNFGSASAPIVSFDCRLTPSESNFMRAM